MNINRISIDAVVNRLELADSPRGVILQIVGVLANQDDGLRVYYDGDILGTEVLCDLEPIYSHATYDEEPEIYKFLIGNNTTSEIPGTKWLRELHFLKSDGEYILGVNRFSIDDLEFYSSNETGMYLDTKYISLDYVYCISEEVDELYGRLKGTGLASNPTRGHEPGLEKAIALLSREKADGSPKFRIGNKVNAHAIKNHLLELAKKYDIGDAKLRSIDDKLNKILAELDLKETKS